MAINLTDLFTQLGKIFGTVEALDTARGTTIPPHVQAIIDEYATLAPNYQNTIAQLPANQITYQQQTASFISQLYGIAGNLIIETVNDDSLQIDRQLSTALRGLILDMIDQIASVDACAVAISAAGIEATNGTALFCGILRYDAQQWTETNAENAFAEVFIATCTSPTSATLVGQQTIRSGSAYGWPDGSGTNTSLTIIDPSSSTNLIPNGDCETLNANNANVPDQWLPITAVPGTTLLIRGPGTSTVTISGTPTSGYYFITISAASADGNVYQTTPLAYNATAEDVQAAIRALTPLFANVTVSSSGTTPNFVHTITWTGAANVTLSSATNAFNTGTSVTANPVASGTVYRQGQSIAFVGNGTELTTIDIPVEVEGGTQYLLAVRARRTTIGSGVLVIELVNDVGTVIGSHSLTLNSAAMSSAFWLAKGVILCTNYPVTTPCYVRLRLSTAIYAAGRIYLDDLTLARVSPLYPGGPVICTVKSQFDSTGDGWLVESTNDRAGGFQTHFERAFGMRNLSLQLPSKSDGSETISDALIS